MKDKMPRVFIGSSQEGLEIAQALQYQLKHDANVTLWSEGIFELTHSYLESLLKTTDEFDYAILVFRADDEVSSRGTTSPIARGNVIFELGLFLGSLGCDRTFVVYDTHRKPEVISDLEGVTFAPFDSSTGTDILSAVGPACFLIRQQLKKRVGGYDPSRLLFLASNPATTTRLSLDREVRAITNALRSLEKRGRLSFAQQWALRADELDSVLQEHSPHFVHISCHGDNDCLMLEDLRGECVSVPLGVVAKLFSLFTGTIRCIVFTSGIAQPVAQTLINKIDCVISLESRMADESVIGFSAAFYEALGNGHDVKRAFDLACLRLAATGEPVEPKLYARAGAAEDLTI
jgi:hypothetical protein